MNATPAIALPKAKFKIVRLDELRTVPHGDIGFWRYDVRPGIGPEIVCRMHTVENTNNLEVFKLALFCRKHGKRLVMYGSPNQFPLLSTFADAIIFLPVVSNLAHIYDDIDSRQGHTVYQQIPGPTQFPVIDLCMKGYMERGEPRPKLIQMALDDVSDEEVVAEFREITVHMRAESYEVFHRLDCQGYIPRGAIVCEIKEFEGCHGRIFRERLAMRAANQGLNVITDRSFLRTICGHAGNHYMAVQCLASIFNGWSWVCYGGSSNLFSFFPFKTLLLSDAYLSAGLVRKLAEARGHGMFPRLNEEQNEFFEFDAVMAQAVGQFSGQR